MKEEIGSQTEPNYLFDHVQKIDSVYGFPSGWVLSDEAPTSESGGEIIINLDQIRRIAEAARLPLELFPWFVLTIMAHEKAHHLQEVRDQQAGRNPDDEYECNRSAYEMEADLLAGYALILFEMYSIGYRALAPTLGRAISSYLDHTVSIGCQVADAHGIDSAQHYRGEDRAEAVKIGRARAAQDLRSWDKTKPLKPYFQKYMGSVREAVSDVSFLDDRGGDDAST